MTLTNAITEINANFRGTDDSPPQLGDDDWNYWVVVLNRKKNEMYDDTRKKWSSAFKPAVKIATIAAGTNSFNLTGTVNSIDLSTFIAPGKKAYIIRLDGTYEYIDVVKPQNAWLNKHQVSISGQQPQVLSLSWSVQANENNIGGTIYLPGYYRPADIDGTNPSAIIPVDDPHWLNMAAAAEIAFNDITYDDKFADLNGKANMLYAQMSHRNRALVANDSQPTPYNVQRIRGFN